MTKAERKYYRWLKETMAGYKQRYGVPVDEYDFPTIDLVQIYRFWPEPADAVIALYGWTLCADVEDVERLKAGFPA